MFILNLNIIVFMFLGCGRLQMSGWYNCPDSIMEKNKIIIIIIIASNCMYVK